MSSATYIKFMEHEFLCILLFDVLFFNLSSLRGAL